MKNEDDRRIFIGMKEGEKGKMDIKLFTDERNFKFRVAGILAREDEILTVRMCKNSFYCLPGGHVELGEDSKNAIIREMKEETGYNVKNPELIAVVENFFKTKNEKKVQELGFYYWLEWDGTEEFKGDYSIIEKDKEQQIELEFKWIKREELSKILFQPSFLIEKIQKGDKKLDHYIAYQ